MQTFVRIVLAACFMTGGLFAEFETWTNQDGNTASMKLIEVIKDGETKMAKFELQNGRNVQLSVDTFSRADADRLHAWKPKVETKSAVDEPLDGNLVILKGRRFRSHTIEEKPEKYYVFYYSASWCGPCNILSPELVRFYEKHRKENQFDVILVSADRDENAMLGFAQRMNMPWPHIRFSKIESLRKQLQHPVPGYPTLIVTDLDGKVIRRLHSVQGLQQLLQN